ncbi:PREDICTED: uncharacterized protein LOC107354692 isoform X2 [Acropora digitifera]|uniref:uncharacterized protein LOC107354692 isoform X2 n=1 Tax=Acropora digitifera TaxID=70779 RepID=UPI00077AA661|nr:PREDICTED: uncharacterized protein LOC107354692 isoform X2 [Acropora digitifera]
MSGGGASTSSPLNNGDVGSGTSGQQHLFLTLTSCLTEKFKSGKAGQRTSHCNHWHTAPWQTLCTMCITHLLFPHLSLAVHMFSKNILDCLLLVSIKTMSYKVVKIL